jgi:Protein of unknown function (DUF2589)
LAVTNFALSGFATRGTLVSCGFYLLGPLSAVVNTQARTALTSLNFIRTFGFDQNNKTITSQFTYLATNASTGLVKARTLRVPLLTLIPVPFLRVRWADLCFLIPAAAATCVCVNVSLSLLDNTWGADCSLLRRLWSSTPKSRALTRMKTRTQFSQQPRAVPSVKSAK